MNSSTTMKTTITDNKNASPDRSLCLKALEEYGTPSNVVGHCKAVAAVGYVLGKAMNAVQKNADNTANGPGLLDLDLILAAGLLHDIARVEEEHWTAGDEFCKSKGWLRVVDIVRQHMTYDPFNGFSDFDETDVVCLADRLVIDDRYAGLDRRMDYIINKAKKNGHDEYIPHILRKKNDIKKLINEIEEYIGISLDDMMSDIDYERPESGV